MKRTLIILLILVISMLLILVCAKSALPAPQDEKWIGWDKPTYLLEKWAIGDRLFEKILSKSAKEIEGPDYYPGPSKPAGCFRFDDGTTQGWTLNQLYGWYINPQKKWELKKITSFFMPFYHYNSQNLAFAVANNNLIIFDKNVVRCVIYLESQDLSKDTNWQNIKGYSVDVHRLFFTWIMQGNPWEKDQKTGKPIIDPKTGKPKLIWPPQYSAQLQMKVVDTSDNSPHHWAEFDQKAQQFIIHPIEFNQNYHLTFKPAQLSNPKMGPYIVKQVRIRITMPGYIDNGELLCSGKWLIGNVCPEK